MSAFDSYLSNRQSIFTKTRETANEAKAESSGGSFDTKYWRPTTEKDGTAFAIIRFLPGLDGETPWINYSRHYFKSPVSGEIYAERSRKTLNERDPVGDLNRKLWATQNDAMIAIAKRQKMNKRYVSNVLVIRDPAKPDNEGKVLMFEYGIKIFDKIQAMMNPDPRTGDEPVNPFDMLEGRNFRVKVKRVLDFPNYDDSTFESSSSPVGASPGDMKVVFEKQFDLKKEFLDPAGYKSYEELYKKLYEVSGDEVGSQFLPPPSDSGNVVERIVTAATASQVPQAKTVETKPAMATTADDDEDDDELASYFKNL